MTADSGASDSSGDSGQTVVTHDGGGDSGDVDSGGSGESDRQR